MSSMHPTLPLPTDRPRPAVQSYRGARETVVLARGLMEALRELSRREQVTLFMTLLAAFQTLLHRYGGMDDVVVGAPIAGRRRVETEGLIGFFVNTLVLRTDLSGDPAFRELLGRVRETVLGGQDHQDLPFEKLVEEVGPPRSPSWAPLVQVMFALQDPDQGLLEFPGVTASRVAVDTGTAKFDLTASVREGPEGLRVTLEYNTDLFEAATIRRMLGHFEMLLGGIAADPGQPLSRLPLLTEAERHQLVVEWNRTQVTFPQSRCIPELFAAQVTRTPAAVAVTFEQQSVTYQQLNQRANQLAHFLRKHGVGPDVLVGLCIERSIDMVAGLLGILKAGGAYVPLDPNDPPHRLAFVLDDAHISVLVTQQRFLPLLPATVTPTVCLDADREALAQEDQNDPVPRATADNLSYVMYTSGSTGRPKGVMITHRGFSNLLAWTQAVFPLNEADVVLQKTPFTFSVWEIYAPLLVGARLVMARPDGHRDTRYLTNTIRAAQISHLKLVPSLLQAMLADAELETCTSLRWVSCGGEVLPPGLLERFRARLNLELVNLYGPTETTHNAAFWVSGPRVAADVVPIGRPIANTQLYILDEHMQPVPIGVPGELYIGGVGLARGYLGRPELTAERFVPSPFGAESGARLYKTGDRARYLTDGNIEYLGRLDHQIKLRGFRIELGEIEATLGQHPGVRESVVLVRDDALGGKRLVAYVVPKSGEAPTRDSLRRFVQSKLPAYMVPSAIALLPSLPLASNGKVDRQSLPAPGTTRADGDCVAPRDVTERQLAQIWEEILGVHPVGVTDNFFELGGHSLLAGRLLARVRERYQVDVSLGAFFAAPTVAGLATTIVQRLAEGVEAATVARVLEELRGLTDEAVRGLLGGAGD
jgi:amino acid adenylation domain-containing protein